MWIEIMGKIGKWIWKRYICIPSLIKGIPKIVANGNASFQFVQLIDAHGNLCIFGCNWYQQLGNGSYEMLQKKFEYII